MVAGDLPARLSGFVVDALVVGVATLVMLTVLGVLHGPVVTVHRAGSIADRVEVDAALFAVDTLAATALAAVYFAGSWVRHGATLGQRINGLQVLPTGPRAARLTIARSLVRFCCLGSPIWVAAGFTSGTPRLALWILGVLWYVVLAASVSAGSSTEGIHDRIAGTMVVRHATRVDIGLIDDGATA